VAALNKTVCALETETVHIYEERKGVFALGKDLFALKKGRARLRSTFQKGGRFGVC